MLDVASTECFSPRRSKLSGLLSKFSNHVQPVHSLWWLHSDGFSMFFQIYFPPFFQIVAQPSPLGIPQPRPSQRSKKPSGRVAMESKKHAARRPRPPLPSAGSASSAKRSSDTWGKPQKGLNHGEKPWGDHGKRFEKPPEMGISDDFIMNLMV